MGCGRIGWGGMGMGRRHLVGCTTYYGTTYSAPGGEGVAQDARGARGTARRCHPSDGWPVRSLDRNDKRAKFDSSPVGGG